MWIYLLILFILWQPCQGEIDEERFHRAQNQHFEGYSYEEEGEWQGPFFFIQMADCQLGMIEHDVCWDKEVLLLEKAVEHINRLKPKFVIVCGDLTNAKPFRPAYKEQVTDYKRVMSMISEDIPLVCICGNHDVGNKPKPETIAAYEDNFGSHYFSFWVGGIQCFGINSSLFFNPKKAPEILEEQKQWLRAELEETSSLNPKHRMVFMHHPWFLVHPDKMTRPQFEIPVDRRKEMLNLLSESNVTACFAGHYHRNAYSHYQGMDLITTAALGKPLGKDCSGFRIVKVLEDRIDHEYVGLEEMPEQINIDDF